MSHVTLIDRDTATGGVRAQLDQIHGAFGVTPNMFRAVANSPAALSHMWGAFGALSAGKIGARLWRIDISVDGNDAQVAIEDDRLPRGRQPLVLYEPGKRFSGYAQGDEAIHLAARAVCACRDDNNVQSADNAATTGRNADALLTRVRR